MGVPGVLEPTPGRRGSDGPACGPHRRKFQGRARPIAGESPEGPSDDAVGGEPQLFRVAEIELGLIELGLRRRNLRFWPGGRGHFARPPAAGRFARKSLPPAPLARARGLRAGRSAAFWPARASARAAIVASVVAVAASNCCLLITSVATSGLIAREVRLGLDVVGLRLCHARASRRFSQRTLKTLPSPL